MNKQQRVAAIVVTYNRHELLSQSLRALLTQTRPVDGLFVIDNASTDDTPLLFAQDAEFDLPIVTHERLDQNVGGAGGFKRGISLATERGFDWCWIMDDDVVPAPDALEALLDADEFLCAHDVRPSFLASSVVGRNGELMNVPQVSRHLSQGGYPDWGEFLEHSLVHIRSATFVSLLIPTDAVREVGLPIEDYFMWGDDGEYTMRLTSYVGPAYLCGRSRVVHLRSAAQPISTVNEQDASRVAHRRRATRNGLINTSAYYGRGETARLLARHMRDCARILLRRDSLKLAKLRAVGGGIADFFARRYDLEDLAKLDPRAKKNY